MEYKQFYQDFNFRYQPRNPYETKLKQGLLTFIKVSKVPKPKRAIEILRETYKVVQENAQYEYQFGTDEERREFREREGELEAQIDLVIRLYFPEEAKQSKSLSLS